ncbi:acetylxylan esterase [Sphaerimonospora thailandensis]|uniref:Acetyl xylan esterase domain-containing protein n=1 Tax=Sphaerimonospora thailandensis TaxID=795644 RepID=A0A8J3R687_9ACTN|nr:acetylxylan esterase [Sphaerimonospora thailandensis]GIH70046.1 hypothetical protein Mth01_22990 [Sphaerimonospora thailandensis]
MPGRPGAGSARHPAAPSPLQAAHTPAQFSVGLHDGVTPLSTVFAAYNHYAGPKDISAWPFNGHEGGGSQPAQEMLGIARKALS